MANSASMTPTAATVAAMSATSAAAATMSGLQLDGAVFTFTYDAPLAYDTASTYDAATYALAAATMTPA